jgi:hypothetical protein
MRRGECPGLARGQWDDNAIRQAASAEGHRAFLPYLQPPALIDTLRASSSWAQREAAKELRGFAGGWPAIVPLWVVTRTGYWATCWAPPGSNVAVVRYQPEPEPENN